jgi:Zn-dependent protease
MGITTQSAPAFTICPKCGTQVVSGFLICPVCKWLVHSGELKRLSAEAEKAEHAEQLMEAQEWWQKCLGLLPPEARQHQVISLRLDELAKRAAATPDGKSKSVGVGGGVKLPRWLLWLGPLVPIGVLLLKFKVVVILVLTKAKFLLLGLTKASTFFSMIASLGLYWTAWGWKFALGLVVSIYIHEMGHVAALRRLGIPASAPMFIPGVGAVVLLKRHVANPRDDARIGLAGPIWGLVAALGCFLVYKVTDAGIWSALAHVGGWITLFNLIPVWQLDGSRGFHAMSKLQRWLVVALIAGIWLVGSDGLFLLLLIGAIYRTTMTKAEEASGDWEAFSVYAGLVVVSAMLCRITPSFK